jgi:ATP-dependent helicase HrpA
MPLGSADELRGQIIDVALDRAFLADPLPTDADSFATGASTEGRGRLNLIAQEVARLAGVRAAGVGHAAQRKLKDSRPAKETADDVAAQLQRLVGKQFLSWPRPGRRWRTCRAT